jgi:peptide chain release factor 2
MNVNKVETKGAAHIPTGIVLICQQDRTQLGNNELAMQMLKAVYLNWNCKKKCHKGCQ